MSDQEKDPVVHSSLSKPLFISSALLVLSMIWGLYDEAYGIRPWKGYQARFVKLYSRYLKAAAGGEADVERQIKASSDYKRLDADMQSAEKAAMPGASVIDKKINQELVPKILALNDPFQEVRSHIGSLTYEIEVSHSDSSKDSLRKQIGELRAEKHDVALPGEPQKRSMDFQAMSDQLQAWKDEKAKLLQDRVDMMKQATALRTKRDQVSVGPDRGGQHIDHRRGAELARKIRYPDSPDPREGCGPGGPLRIVPPGYARAGDDYQGVDWRRGGIHQPSE